MKEADLKPALVLAIITVVAASLIITVDRLTGHERKAARTAYLHSQLSTVIDVAFDNEPLSEAYTAASGDVIYPLSKSGRTVGLVVKTHSSEGYGGDIEMLIGFDAQQRMTGVRPLAHRETPGLGDRIDMPDGWIGNFAGLNPATPMAQWQVRKDGGQFDNLSGATITARAVLRQAHKTLKQLSMTR